MARHKWRKGDNPVMCGECGLIKEKRIVKALVNGHEVYQNKMVYIDLEGVYMSAPECKQFYKP